MARSRHRSITFNQEYKYLCSSLPLTNTWGRFPLQRICHNIRAECQPKIQGSQWLHAGITVKRNKCLLNLFTALSFLQLWLNHCFMRPSRAGHSKTPTLCREMSHRLWGWHNPAVNCRWHLDPPCLFQNDRARSSSLSSHNDWGAVSSPDVRTTHSVQKNASLSQWESSADRELLYSVEENPCLCITKLFCWMCK